jgi:hypothetical protein
MATIRFRMGDTPLGRFPLLAGADDVKTEEIFYFTVILTVYHDWANNAASESSRPAGDVGECLAYLRRCMQDDKHEIVIEGEEERGGEG